MKVSCVLPVHNEEAFLQYSLPSLKSAGFNEVVAVLDRCTDNSKLLLEKYGDETFKLITKNRQTWHDGCSETKHLGCLHADGDLIMISDADIVLDRNTVKKAVEKLQKDMDVAIFLYRQYSLRGGVRERFRDELQNLLAKIVRRLKLQPTRTGIYMAHKNVLKIQDTAGQYDFLQQASRAVTLNSHTLHLRPRRSKQAQLKRGRLRARLPQYNFWKVLLMSMLLLMPYMIVGYWREKH